MLLLWGKSEKTLGKKIYSCIMFCLSEESIAQGMLSRVVDANMAVASTMTALPKVTNLQNSRFLV